MISKSSAVPKYFPDFKFSDSVEILKFWLEYTVESFGSLHLATVALEIVSSKTHSSSQTEMMPYPSFKIEERPVDVTSNSHPPANEHSRPELLESTESSLVKSIGDFVKWIIESLVKVNSGCSLATGTPRLKVAEA